MKRSKPLGYDKKQMNSKPSTKNGRALKALFLKACALLTYDDPVILVWPKPIYNIWLLGLR
jgi:hypothetical protein